jgi:protein-S-isoprenylcysteine O-methyltransferase Ste14
LYLRFILIHCLARQILFHSLEKTSMTQPSAATGRESRGEWYIAGQGVLFILLALGPRTLPLFPAWSTGWSTGGRIAGGVLLVTGGALALAGAVSLGRDLTPFVQPRERGILHDSGPYRLVRHPVYSGLLQLAFGWGLWVQGWLTLGYALLLLVLLDCKARTEEKWLLQLFPEYVAYRRRVSRFLPFLY